VTYKRNFQVYNQGDRADKVFIVKSGEFEIIRIAKYRPKRITDDSKVRLLLGPTNRTSIKAILKNEAHIPNAKRQEVRLSAIRAGQCVGIEDALNNRNYTTSVRCTSSTGQCYMLKANEFFVKIGKDDRSWKMITDSLYVND